MINTKTIIRQSRISENLSELFNLLKDVLSPGDIE